MNLPNLPYVFGQQTCANSLDPEETSQNAAAYQDLHYLPLIQQFLDTTSASKLIKFWNKYGKELRCPNT